MKTKTLIFIHKIVFKRQTVYVHVDVLTNTLRSVHLGGDYLDITAKLSPAEKKKIASKVNAHVKEVPCQ